MKRVRSPWIITSVSLALLLLIPSMYSIINRPPMSGQHVQAVSLYGVNEHVPAKHKFISSAHYSIVEVISGDYGISQSEVNHVSELIKQTASPILQRNLGSLPSTQTKVYLYSTEDGYRSAVSKAFAASEVPIVLAQTGGFTLGSQVFIPIYKYDGNATLVNTLTHELTHVTLNGESLGGKIPTWMNEGLAWYNGTEAEELLNNTASKQMAWQLFAQLKQARQQGQLRPIAADGSSVLNKDPAYNVEFQDYLGVRYLIRKYGLSRIQELLKTLHDTPFNECFNTVFGISTTSFTMSFTGLPSTAAVRLWKQTHSNHAR